MPTFTRRFIWSGAGKSLVLSALPISRGSERHPLLILQMGKPSTKEVVLAEGTEQRHYWDPGFSAYVGISLWARLGYLPLANQAIRRRCSPAGCTLQGKEYLRTSSADDGVDVILVLFGLLVLQT